MEGIMNLPAGVGGATSQDGLDSFAPLIAAQQTARDMGYPRFTRELLSAGSEMDQAEVQEFLQTIRDAGLTSDDVSMMRRVVEAVFGDPNNYPEVRARLLAEGVPEDILPETFDLEFFVALRMAVEEAENLSQEPRPTGQEMPMEAPVGMAEGGIVSSIRSVLDRMQEQPVPVNTGEGRGSITSSIHGVLNRMREARGEKPLARRESREEVIERLREQYPSLFGSLTPVRMAEGGIVGLPQMTPIAREMAAMGRNGDTMLAHITPQEAMMLQRMGGSGTINPYTGLPEFFLKKLFRGVGKAFKSVGKAVKKFAKSTVGRIVIGVALGAFLGPMAGGLLGGVGPAASFGLSAGLGTFGSSLLAGDGFKTALRSGLTAGALSFAAAGVFGQAGFSGAPAAGAPTTFTQGLEQGIANVKAPFQAAADFVRGGPEAAASSTTPGVGTATEQLASAPPAEAGAFGRFGAGDTQFERAVAQGRVVPSDFASLAEPRSFLDTVTQGAQDVYTGAKDVFTDYLSPSRASIQPPSLQDAVAQVKADYVSSGLKIPADDIVMASAKKLVTEQTPGMLAKYGPIAAVAGTTLAATGGLDSLFKVPVPEGMTQEEFDAQRAQEQAQFRQDRPAFFGSFTRPEYYSQPTYRAAKGSGPEGVEDFPRKNGAINGPGTGTSDDIPAMLSDGEFVFTAKSVRNMGGGSRRKGAAKMYKLMKMLEGGPVSKTAGA